ncbi:hypothetical protein BJV78DRAFT_1153497 [Lactifluus subvellereus]|nr:hypothetical protein BJV78DRAFT_1153497 [Lactifluus subvellereus]
MSPAGPSPQDHRQIAIVQSSAGPVAMACAGLSARRTSGRTDAVNTAVSGPGTRKTLYWSSQNDVQMKVNNATLPRSLEGRGRENQNGTALWARGHRIAPPLATDSVVTVSACGEQCRGSTVPAKAAPVSCAIFSAVSTTPEPEFVKKNESSEG